MTSCDELLSAADAGERLADGSLIELGRTAELGDLLAVAGAIRDEGHRNLVSYSRKVFIPLTHLCRDVCHYCTFAKVPGKVEAPYLTPDQVLEIVKQGEANGCREALFTLGDKPELRYTRARDALEDLGHESTISYLAEVADLVLRESSLLPHVNPGLMTRDEYAMLRERSISMGIMLESSSERLTEKGMPHYGSPDKVPARRIENMKLAGEMAIPFTSGILIGIGETREERIESLLALRRLHEEYGHLQEVIVQNFRAKPDTLMAEAPEPDLDELLWTIALARIVFGAEMNIQAPPNLSPGVLSRIIDAGINDWGGVSPVTPDFVNPEAPWPHLRQLAEETAKGGKHLLERLAIYPAFAREPDRWVAPELRPRLLAHVDGEGFAKTGPWSAGAVIDPPDEVSRLVTAVPGGAPTAGLSHVLERAAAGEELSEQDVVRLLAARGGDFTHVCQAADRLRREVVGDTVTYVVNRNINYTNVCYFRCQFCAFSKGKTSENLRGAPYMLEPEEIMRRTREAYDRGATEVCLQGGIHPEYTGSTYVDICHTIKQVVPEMHIHGFSPLEVWQGARTLDLSLAEYLEKLKLAGLDTLPGTAAEILDDEVRAELCPDKLTTSEWFEVMETAHEAGFRTTATIMYGHIERYEHVARHLLRLRRLQQRTGGFTEFVVLPFIHMEAPIFRKGRARSGPSYREAVLIHAVARLALHPFFSNIQGSWTKLGLKGVADCLNAGVNDLGGTLMNETITRAAGASHGQETTPEGMEALITSLGRTPAQRTTLYERVSASQREKSMGAPELAEPVYTSAAKYQRERHRKRGDDRLISSVDIV